MLMIMVLTWIRVAMLTIMATMMTTMTTTTTMTKTTTAAKWMTPMPAMVATTMPPIGMRTNSRTL